MKWSSIHPARDYLSVRAGRFARRLRRGERDEGARAYARLVSARIAAWLTSGTWNQETLKVVLKEHIDSVVGHYRGKVVEWDVVNEAFNDGTARCA